MSAPDPSDLDRTARQAAGAAVVRGRPAPPLRDDVDKALETMSTVSEALVHLRDRAGAVQARADDLARRLAAAERQAEDAEQRAEGAEQRAEGAEQRAETLAEDLMAERERLSTLQEEADGLRAETAGLRQELEIQRRTAAPARPVPAAPSQEWTPVLVARPAAARPSTGRPNPWAPTPPAPRPTPTAPAASRPAVPDAPTPASVFVAWCRRGGGLVGRVEQFGQALAAELPDAAVRRVYRDADSPARPVRLQEDTGVSPVEYWAVTIHGAAVLFPQPLGPGQFRELAPCFEGQAVPASVTEVRPARVRPAGGGYVVEAPGAVG